MNDKVAGIYIPGLRLIVDRDDRGIVIVREDGEPMEEWFALSVMKLLAKKIEQAWEAP